MITEFSEVSMEDYSNLQRMAQGAGMMLGDVWYAIVVTKVRGSGGPIAYGL